ncbi:unnamed protein product [Clonostachys byssicola]|uniref:PD-(D/E)XK nuclease-like domain-containing protein n=1 Tax=Clonostachys byssicola TaxID=160290 RepID=A0A9N9UIY7_9HYPO|nr:unnamed protein product [Clonostachys byssicola]
MGLNLDIGGLECKQLDNDYPPLAAASLVQELLEIDMGIDILLYDKKRLNIKPWRSVFKDKGINTLPGCVPSWEELNTVCERAIEYFNSDYEEFSWNIEVYYRLLKSIFRGSGEPSTQPFDFILYYIGTIYLVLQGKRWWIFTSLMVPTLMLKRAEYLLSTVNYTDYRPLQLYPITLSIKTKRSGKDLDVVQLQIGSAVKAVITSTQPDRTDEEAITDTLFVFSMLEPQNITLEDGTNITEFGSMQSILKMYQIVAGLCCLAGWAKEFYMPWY